MLNETSPDPSQAKLLVPSAASVESAGAALVRRFNNLTPTEVKLIAAQARIADLEAQLAAAKEVIARIPHTADGVPVDREMHLYSPPKFYGGVRRYRGRPFDAVAMSEGEPMNSALKVAVLYSTHEAAVAARAGGGAT